LLRFTRPIDASDGWPYIAGASSSDEVRMYKQMPDGVSFVEAFNAGSSFPRFEILRSSLFRGFELRALSFDSSFP
jgi:hypothetical protein